MSRFWKLVLCTLMWPGIIFGAATYMIWFSLKVGWWNTEQWAEEFFKQRTTDE